VSRRPDAGAGVAVEVGVSTVLAADDSLDYRLRPRGGDFVSGSVSSAKSASASGGAAVVFRERCQWT